MNERPVSGSAAVALDVSFCVLLFQADPQRSHSIILGRQRQTGVPRIVVEATGVIPPVVREPSHAPFGASNQRSKDRAWTVATC